jgi:diguanylate cyclase (GGDEF)-like protein
MAKVLIVDDIASNRDLLASILRYMGHQSLEAADGAEALAILRRELSGEAVALLICDVLMPVMDGYELMSELRQETSPAALATLPVIFQTAHYLEGEALALARACGVTEVLAKPYGPEEVIAVVQRVLAGREPPPVVSTAERAAFEKQHLALVSGKLLEKSEEIRAANQRMASLIELNLQLTAEREVHQLLERVCSGARLLLGARVGYLAVRRDDGEALLHVSQSASLDQALAAGPVGLEAGLPGEILRQRQTRRVRVAPQEFARLGLPAGHPAATELLLAPITSLSESYGWICLSDREDGEPFSEVDERLLGILAAQVGRFYEINVLYLQVERHADELEREAADRQVAQRRLAAQYAVAQALVEAEALEEAFPYVLSAICRELGFTAGALWQVDERDTVLRCVDAWHGPGAASQAFAQAMRGLALPPGVGVPGRAWASGGYSQLADIASDPDCPRHAWARQAGLHAAVAMPIKVRGQIAGVIDLLRASAEAPDSGTMEMLSAFGNQLGQFFERVDQRRHIMRLSRVYAVLSGINAAIVRLHDRQALFDEACRIAVEQGRFDLAWIGELDAASGEVRPVAAAGSDEALDGELLHASRDAPGVVGQALRQGVPACASDLDASASAALWRHGFRSQIALPLVADGAAMGVIVFYSREAGLFVGEELGLLVEMAGDISFALEYIGQQDRLAYLAHYDPLTSLGNRTLLMDRLGQAIIFAERGEHAAAVLLLDLDRFKAVNDTLGHAAGDELLLEVAHRLRTCVREGDTVARLGGDEFVVLLAEVAQESDIVAVARKILVALAAPLQIAGAEVYALASIGASLYPRDGHSPETLLKNADVAMYRAKEQGGNEVCFYANEMESRARHALSLEGALRRALERGELALHYQPQVDLATGAICGAEALLRWQREDGEMVSPAEFIPVAEESGLILPIGRWVIATATAQAQAWQAAGLPPLPVAVNLSTRQFREPDLVRRVADALAEAGLASRWLEIEITESLMFDHFERALAVLSSFRELGLTVALDDFGTGYSSLSYLKRLPIDVVKIDRSFVRDLSVDPDDAAIVQAIIGMAHSLGLKVLAEGVESEAQSHYLRARGCDRMQGFLFSKALPAEAFAELLWRGERLPGRPGDEAARPRTLLLVDDEPHVLTALRRVLRREGYRIFTADSALAGLEILAREEVQVVLSDQRMPGMSGTEFLDRARRMHPDTVRLILSGYADLQSVTEAVNRGAVFRFLHKPWDEALLRQSLREAFAFQAARSHSVTA